MNDELIPATVASESVDSQQVEQADQLGVSTGKLKIAQELLALTRGQYSLEELLNMSVKELMQIRKEKQETGGGQANVDEEENNENASEDANKGSKQQPPSPVVLPSIKQDPSPETPLPDVTKDKQNNAGGNKDAKANPASDKDKTNSKKDTDADEAADTSQ